MFKISDHISEANLKEFCSNHRIKLLSLFGSALRDEMKPDSDIDILVEFEYSRTPGLITFIGIQRELTELIGRQVDLRTPGDLSEYFRNNIVSESKAEYVS